MSGSDRGASGHARLSSARIGSPLRANLGTCVSEASASSIDTPSSSNAPTCSLVASVDPDGTRRAQNGSKIVCLGCRTNKMKCVAGTGAELNGRCARCVRLDRACEYVEPRPRGRKRKRRSASLEQPAVSTPASAVAPSRAQGPSATVANTQGWSGVHMLQDMPQTAQPQIDLTASLPAMDADRAIATSPSAHAQAQQDGAPSLAGVVEARSVDASRNSDVAAAVQPQFGDGARQSSRTPSRLTARLQPSRESYLDPVDIRLLSPVEGEQLLASYFAALNPWIALLDPKLHTAEYLRSTSPILHAAVLAVAAKYFRRDLYERLHGYAQQVVGRGMVEAFAHISLAQALCVLAYWREPTDSTAWVKIGVAVRLGYQMRLHVRPKDSWPQAEMAARHRLDAERTWLVLVMLDHAYRLQGDDRASFRPRMTRLTDIDVDEYLRKSAHVRTPHDATLCALIEASRVHLLADSVTATSSESLIWHMEGMLQRRREMFSLPAAPYGAGIDGAAALKLDFHDAYASFAVARARLTCNGQSDSLSIALLIPVVEALATTYERLIQQGQLHFMMDTAAMPAFLMADFLVKVYASASPPARTTIVQVLSRMYSAYDKYTNNASGSVCYIAQFYTIILRRLAISASPSSSRRASPPAGDAAPADEHALLENFYSNSLEPDLLSGLAAASQELDTQDLSYWEQLFPGLELNAVDSLNQL